MTGPIQNGKVPLVMTTDFFFFTSERFTTELFYTDTHIRAYTHTHANAHAYHTRIDSHISKQLRLMFFFVFLIRFSSLEGDSV